MSNTFSLSTTLNGVIAVIAGLVAEVVAERWGYVAPFITSLGCLIVGMTLAVDR